MREDLLERARRALEGMRTPAPAIDRVERRARTLRLRRNLAAATAAIVVAVGLIMPILALRNLEEARQPANETPVPAEPAPVLDFEPAPGWHVVTTDPSDATLLGIQAWASNVPFADGERPDLDDTVGAIGWPDRTDAALPPDGVLLVASYVIESRNPLPQSRSFPERALPLTIDDPPSVAYEGQEPDRALSVVNATVNGRYVTVRIVFGQAEPKPDLVREAEEELGRLIVATAPGTTTALDDFGIRMDPPDAWHGILFRWPVGAPVLHAATVPITDLYDGSSARKALAEGDAFIVLSENQAMAAHYEQVQLPIAIRPSDLCPTCEILDDGTSPPPTHSLYYRSFALSGRQFELFVELGTPNASDEGLAEINAILATLRIDPSGAPPPIPAAPDEMLPIDVDLPVGWVEEPAPVPGSAVVAAYGTWNFPEGGACGPEPALAALPTDGALVWIVEHATPGNAADFIELWPRYSMDLQIPPARWDCAAVAPSREELFLVSGRFLEVHIALGPGATSGTVDEVNRLIRSLTAARA